MSIPTTPYSGHNPMIEQISFLLHPVIPYYINLKSIMVANTNPFSKKKKKKVFQLLPSSSWTLFLSQSISNAE